MRANNLVLPGLMILLAATSSLALYYRSRVIAYEAECAALRERVNKAEVPAHSPTPAVGFKTRAYTQPEPQIIAEAGAAAVAAAGERMLKLESQPTGQEDTAFAPTGTESARSADRERQRRRGFDWLENIRTNDPARYKEIQQRREEMQDHAKAAWDQATDYFINRDTSSMGDPEVLEYNRMMTLLEQTRAYSQMLQSNLEQEVRRQLMFNMRSNMVELAPLLDNERNREFYDLAVGAGLPKSDATSFVSYVVQIISNTSMRAILPGIRGGGFGFRPPDRPPTPPAQPIPALP